MENGLRSRTARSLGVLAGLALLVCAGTPAAHAAPGGPTARPILKVTGAEPNHRIPYGRQVTLTVHVSGLPPGVMPTLGLYDMRGVPPTAAHLACTMRPDVLSCPQVPQDTSSWTPQYPHRTTTSYTIRLTLVARDLPEYSVLEIEAGSAVLPFLVAPAAAKPAPAKPGGSKLPDLSGKVTVKCGSKLAAEPEGSASYKTGGKVALDGSITLTVPCGLDGKPDPAPKPIVAVAESKGGSSARKNASTPSTGGSGTTVIIAGAGLTGVRKVLFGHVPAKRFRVVSAYKIVATAPAGKGTVYLLVVGPKGASEHVAKARFRYVR